MTDGAPTYSGRVAVVTGASRGLGRALAAYFVGRGANVVGLSRGEATIDQPGYRHESIDIGDDGQVRSAFISIGRALGRADILVNSAAVLTSQHALVMPAERAEE